MSRPVHGYGSQLRGQGVAALVAASLLVPVAGGCDFVGVGNPTPGAEPYRFGTVWVRHRKDKYDRDAYVQVGFTLKDSKGKAIAASGDLAVELKWKIGMMEWIAKGTGRVRASSFREAVDKPVRDGTWYVEPWSINVIGAQYPGPAEHGYDASLTFTAEDGDELTFHRWVNITR